MSFSEVKLKSMSIKLLKELCFFIDNHKMLDDKSLDGSEINFIVSNAIYNLFIKSFKSVTDSMCLKILNVLIKEQEERINGSMDQKIKMEIN